MPKVNSPAVGEPANPFSTNDVGSSHRCEKSLRAHEIGRPQAGRADLDGTRAGQWLWLGEFLEPGSGALLIDDKSTHAIFPAPADRGSLAAPDFLPGQCSLPNGRGSPGRFVF